MRLALASLAVSLAWVLACPSSVGAHGRPPYVERIAFDPNDPERIVLQFSFGLAVSEDAGASWYWICGSAYGIDASWEDPDLAITEDGSTILGTYATAVRGAPDLCTFERPGGSIDDVDVLDLARDPHDADVVWALTTRGGGEPEHLQRTDDGGRSWTTVGEPFDALLESIALAPSDPARVYVTAIVPATDVTPGRSLLLRSADGGETFTPIELETREGERAPIVVGVDPTDADRVFVRMPRGQLDRDPERLIYSEDGGATFATIHSMRGMRGFAISDDGRTVWVGSATGDGVWIARDGALSFTQINTLHVRCLAARGDELWLCVDQLTSGFALGRSVDQGASVEELLYLDTLEARPACPTCSATAVVCPFWADDLENDFVRYFGTEPSGAPIDPSIPAECIPDAGSVAAGRDAGTDAGLAMDGGVMAPPQAGCGCRAAVSRGEAGLPAILALAGIVALRRRRRR